jgi:UPF0755 protein
LRKTNKIKTYFTFGICIAAITLMIVSYYTFIAPNYFEGEKLIAVSKGMTFANVVDTLKSIGVIRNKYLFELAGRILNKERKVRIGKFLFRSGMTNPQILADLTTGRSALLIKVTIPEGLRASAQASILRAEVGIDSQRFFNRVFDESFIKSVGVESASLEGYLMPNTYQFYWQTDEEEIIKIMVQEFWKVYNDTFIRRTESLGLTVNEVITMASIVEAETNVPDERAIIAGVYYNRIKRRMLLQADPTVQYLLDDGPRRLKYKDLQRESPYNTYRNVGLPPGPVNNPGRDAIIAALYPAKHSYLYFVASGASGHIFSSNYSEHQSAVKKYRKKIGETTKYDD